MKVSDIVVGRSYRNKSGSGVRQVLKLDRVPARELTGAGGDLAELRDAVLVRIDKQRGLREPVEMWMLPTSFAQWAHEPV